VLFTAQIAGLLAIAVAVAIRGRGPASATVLLAVPAALSGTLGLWAYYRGVAVGAMSVVAPIAGVSAVVPVAVGVATGDRPTPYQVAGIALAIVGVGLAAREHQADGDRRVAAGVGLALLAAIGFGTYFVPMHAAGDADFWWASLIFRATSFAVIAGVAFALRSPVRVSRGAAAFVAAVGIGDTLGNLLYAASAAYGLVSVTAVLASLYPIVTVVLARILLHERVDRVQEAGIATTLAGVVLISAGF
jgi:drug/metabolite transporter (DMT)-like permease